MGRGVKAKSTITPVNHAAGLLNSLKRKRKPVIKPAVVKKLKLSKMVNNSQPQIDVTEMEESSENEPLTVGLLTKLLSANTKVITDKFDKLEQSFTHHQEKIDELETEVDVLKKTVSKMTSENEQLWKEITKLNLVFSGVHENVNESMNDLYSIVSRIMREVMGEKCEFDTAHRVGKVMQNVTRPIKVRFFSMSQRNAIWMSRFNAKRPIFINEDLPLSTRKDHGVMRQKKKLLLNNGYSTKEIRMDWKKKVIQTVDSSFLVKDGVVVEQQQQQSFQLTSNNMLHGYQTRPNPRQEKSKVSIAGGNGHQQPLFNFGRNDTTAATAAASSPRPSSLGGNSIFTSNPIHSQQSSSSFNRAD
jgi:regulator of replication initiation timing